MGLQAGLLTVLFQFIENSLPGTFFSDQFVTSTLDFWYYVGLVVFAVSVIFMIFNIAEAKASGEQVSYGICFSNFLKALFLLYAANPLVICMANLSFTVSQKIVSGILLKSIDITPPSITPTNGLGGVLSLFGTVGQWLGQMSQGAIVQFFVFVVTLVVSIAMFFQLLKMFATFYIQIVSGYLYIGEVMMGDGSALLMWFRDILASCVTFALEYSFYIGGLADMNANSYSDLAKCAPGLALLVAAPAIPMILRKFGFDHGTAGSMKGAVSGLGQAFTGTMTILAHVA